MPIYEYRCLECGFQEEFLQKLTEPTKTVCPSCGKESFQKLVSAAGFQLKGSGWYATDFKNSGAKPSKGGDGGMTSAAKPSKGGDGGSKEARGEGGAKPESEGSSAGKTEPKKESAAA